jgi:Flp pilus assembly protein TadD
MKRIAACSLLLSLGACSNAAGQPASEGALKRGAAALAAGQPRTAKVEFLNAIKARPNDGRVRLLQAETYLALADGVAAQAEIERARQLGAGSAETGHLMAHALLLQGQHKRAVEEASAAAPVHAAYAARIAGEALAAAGDNEGADQFEIAAAAAPQDHRVWIAIARFRRSNGDLAGALAHSAKAVALKPRDVEALTLRGELTRSQYGLRAALPWFDKALEIDPNNVVALLERAATLGDMGEMQAMLADTRKVLSLSPANPMAFYLQAMLAARAGEFDLARSLYQRTRGALAGQPAAMLLAAAIDYETGSASQAVTGLEKLVAMQPDNLKARRLLAAAQWKLGDAAATAATLRPLADRPDADSYSLSLIGRALARQGDMAAASFYLARAAQPQRRSPAALLAPIGEERLGKLRHAAAMRPNDPQAKVQLISGLLANGLLDEGLALAQSLQAANPGVPNAHMAVGDALGARGDHAGAALEYRKAANLAFTEPVAMRMIQALEKSGDRLRARQVLQLFLDQNPRNVPAQLLAADAYMEARRWPEAIGIYENLRARLGDTDAVMLNNLAWAYAAEGDLEAAVPVARRAWALDGHNPATAETLGWLLFKSGQDRMKGLALLERSARGAPNDAEMRRRLGAAPRG